MNSLEVNKDKSNKLEQKKNPIRELIELIIFVVVFVLFINVYLVQGYQIPTGSMEKTLLVGDRIFVNKFIYSPIPSFLKWLFPVKEPERGEIIIFKYPEDMRKVFVKRLVGLPGETLRVEDKKVYADNRRIEFPGKERFFRRWSGDYYGPVTIPSDHYFMMGDNRDNSKDSRSWGFLDKNLVRGKILCISFSIRKSKPQPRIKDKSSSNGICDIIRWDRTLNFVK